MLTIEELEARESLIHVEAERRALARKQSHTEAVKVLQSLTAPDVSGLEAELPALDAAVTAAQAELTKAQQARAKVRNAIANKHAEHDARRNAAEVACRRTADSRIEAARRRVEREINQLCASNDCDRANQLLPQLRALRPIFDAMPLQDIDVEQELDRLLTPFGLDD